METKTLGLLVLAPLYPVLFVPGQQ